MEMLGGVVMVEMLGGVVMTRLLTPMAQAHTLGRVVDMLGGGIVPGTAKKVGAAAQIGIRRMIVTLRLTIGTVTTIGIRRAIVNGIHGMESESEGMVDIIRKVGRLAGFAAYTHPPAFAAMLFSRRIFGVGHIWSSSLLLQDV